MVAGRLRRQLTEDEIDSLGDVDVLVIPVGGGDALGAIDAAKLVNAVEPSIVVPARYGSVDGGEYDPVGKFAKEMGLAEGTWEPQPKLSSPDRPARATTLAWCFSRSEPPADCHIRTSVRPCGVRLIQSFKPSRKAQRMAKFVFVTGGVVSSLGRELPQRPSARS